ncbi:hypothetical protein DL96DRAFT_1609984 [Flagelloscypha sp. PMI_526]|nr:hypothetical protein DL96DRAFT_1609984 [Flagelloscypha sp. PMI_526]
MSSESLPHVEKGKGSDVEVNTEDVFAKLVQSEEDHDIKFRTLSWQKTALLLLTEYVCLAMLALAWSFMVLGWGAGIAVTLVLAVSTWYTSYTCWQYCMKHPHIRDVVDIALQLTGGNQIAGEATAIMLLLNNICIMGFHVLTGSKIFNTLSDHSQCTVVFQVLTAIICFIFSIPRTLQHVLTTGGPSVAKFIPAFNATLNITFLFIGQIMYPSFIAEMKEPKDFPKALTVLTVAEVIIFFLAACIGYAYNGQYSTAPLIGSLQEPWMKKSAFAFVLVPTIVIAALYANVAGKYIYRRVLGDSRHAHSHTIVGWGTWIFIQAILWAVSWILGETIPSMGDFLGIMSAAFDSFFGYLFWAAAWFELNRGRYFHGVGQTTLFITNVIIFGLGLLMLGPGLWTSIEAVIDDYAAGTAHAFNCKDNAL